MSAPPAESSASPSPTREELEEQDEALYEEVLQYLMKGSKAHGSEGADSPVSHMPAALERALGNRHVTIEEEPREIIPGPVRFLELPLGIALLFDVATDEDFTERWHDRTLEPLASPNAASNRGGEASGEESKDRKLVAEGGGGGGGEKKDGEDDKKEGDAADKKKDDGAAAAASGGDNDDDKEGGEGQDGDDDEDAPKKKKRIVQKGGWGGPKPDKPPPQKKYSTLYKPPPRPAVEYTEVDDINEGMQLLGPPQWIPYLCTLLSLPPPREDRCISLYESGRAAHAHLQEVAKTTRQKREEDDIATCTFHPVVSDAVKKLPGWKGDMVKFYTDKLEWVKQVNRKLEKKIIKQNKEKEEEYEQFKVGEGSKKVLARRERRLKAMGVEPGETPPRVADRRGVELSDSAKKASGMDRDAPSFTPVTNTYRHRGLMSAKPSAASPNRRGGGGDDDNNGEGGADLVYNYTSILDEFATPQELIDHQEGLKEFLSRMEDDLNGRCERKKERALQFLKMQKEKLFDPVTGQPLFEPNAAPTVVRQDGSRISFHDLSGKEQKDLIRRLKNRGRLDFVPGITRNRVGDHTIRDDDMQAMYKRMLEKVRQGTVRIDRIRRREDRELDKLFRPTIDPNTNAMLAQGGGTRVPLHKLPLKRPPPPPPPKPQPKSSAEKMSHVVERNSTFSSTKKETLERKVADKIASQKCSFQPFISPETKRIVKERTARWQQEIAIVDQAKQDYHVRTQADNVHYASELERQQNSNNSQQQQQREPSPQEMRFSMDGPSVLRGQAVRYENRRHHIYQDPQVAHDAVREEQWARPNARRVANHYYFEYAKDTTNKDRKSPSPNSGNRRFAAAAAGSGSGSGSGSGGSSGGGGSGRQQQPQPQQQHTAAADQQQPYDDLDHIVGSMLQSRGTTPNSGGAAGVGAGAAGAGNNNAGGAPRGAASAASPASATQQLHFASQSPTQQQQPAAAGGSVASDSGRSPVSGGPRTAASQQQQQQQQPTSGSARRLESILHSWDDLDRQVAAVL